VTSFATPADLASYLQTTVDTASAQLSLDLATALIKNYTRQTLSYVADDTVVLRGNTAVLLLPQRPVVGTPVVNGLVPSAVYRFDPPDRLTYGVPSGNLAAAQYANGPNPVYGVWPLAVTVTYSHGYQVIPDDIRGACISVAARAYDNPQGLRGETIGSYSVQYAGAGDILVPGVALSGSEEQILNRYRRRSSSLSLS
jgi:hypothetical protein